LLLSATALGIVLARGGVGDGDPVRTVRVDSIVRGRLAVEPAAQWAPTVAATVEPTGDEGPPASETPGARKSDAAPAPRPGDPGVSPDVQPGAAPGRDAEGATLSATHYGGGAAWGDSIGYACWPAELWPAVAAVEQCESHGGEDPLTWDLNRSQSGRMQLDRATWEVYFLERGWTWEQVIFDQTIHFCAAWEVYQRSGGWGPWPNCQP